MITLNCARVPLTLTRRLEKLNWVLTRFLEQNASSANQQSSLKSTHELVPPAGKMLAWQIECYGDVDVLKLSTKCPEPIVERPGDVKIKVLATSVNPIDVAMMGGYGSVLLNAIHQAEYRCSKSRSFPITLGRDFVGRVEIAGQQVSNVKVGDEVWGVVTPWTQGAHAQNVVVPAGNVRRMPANISVMDMAALPYAAVTAWSALQLTGEMAFGGRGKRVLILGGSGAVGSIAIQMAKAWKAYVVATCSTDAIPMVESLGPNGVVDYTQRDFMRQIMEHGHFDVVLDAAGLGTDAGIYANCLNHWANAKYVTLSSPLLRNIDKHGLALGLLKNITALFDANVTNGIAQKGASSRWGFFLPCAPCLDEIQRLVESNKVIPIIHQKFSFQEMPDAYRRMKAGHLRGKLVVDATNTS